MTQTTWRGEVSLAYASTSCSFVTEGSQSRILEDPPWCHGGELLTGLLLVACSACCLIEPRTTCPGVASAPLPHQSLTKEMSYSWIWWRHFLSGVPSSQMILAVSTWHKTHQLRETADWWTLPWKKRLTEPRLLVRCRQSQWGELGALSVNSRVRTQKIFKIKIVQSYILPQKTLFLLFVSQFGSIIGKDVTFWAL